MRTYLQVLNNLEEEKMFDFPTEIWNIIWKSLFTSTVLKELEKCKSIWSPEKIQSGKLKQISTEDIGAIQFKYTDFDKLVNEHHYPKLLPQDIPGWIPGMERFMIMPGVERHLHDKCLNGACLNCREDGFPCSNLTWHGLSRNIKKNPMGTIQYGEIWKVK